MKEHYVSYECAQALKRLGFKEEVSHYYIQFKSDGEVKLWSTNPPSNHNERLSNNEICSAPRLDQAAAWIWEKYKLWIEVTIKAKNDFTLCVVDEYGEVKFIGDGKDSIPNTYIAGISKALELFGKEEKV